MPETPPEPDRRGVLGVGLDLVDVDRMTRELAREDGGLRDRVFTPDEIAYCEGKGRPAVHFAARFAAKEAFFKALGTGWRGAGPTWSEVEVVRDVLGAPTLRLSGAAAEAAGSLGVRSTHLSLTHTATLAAAAVVLEG
jgi:holo-[acyl-carrier protein] synthase